MTIRCCELCEFWVEVDVEFEDGECHRLPPCQFVDDEGVGGTAEFPLVSATNWCGEFREKAA